MKLIQMFSVRIVLVSAGILAFSCLLSNVQKLPNRNILPHNDIEQIGKDATVRIIVRTTDGVLGSGSGFFKRTQEIRYTQTTQDVIEIVEKKNK